MFLVAFVIAVSLVGWLALGPKEGPYGPGDMVPVGSTNGEVYGEALLDDLHRMAKEGGRVEVHNDGDVVGHMTQDGFQPLERDTAAGHDESP